jgi:hypothetical protein
MKDVADDVGHPHVRVPLAYELHDGVESAESLGRRINRLNEGPTGVPRIGSPAGRDDRLNRE